MHVVATEKLDGANLGVYVPVHGLPSFYSRNGLDAENLYNFANDKNQLKGFIEIIQGYFQAHESISVVKGYWFWGEYFGSGIMKRINYTGQRGQFRFYDAMPDMERGAHLDPQLLAMLTDAVDGWASKNHCEKASVNSPVLSRLRELFKGYVTLNRAQGILTKTPERRKLDKLVKMLIQDAREDFMNDHGAELEGFDDKMIRKVFNAGADPFMRIKEAIALEVQ